MLADCYDRVERRHRILEDGCDARTADLLPVLCVLDFCEVEHAHAVELRFGGAVEELDSERNRIENLIALLVVCEVDAKTHRLTQCENEFDNKLKSFECAVSSDGKINFLA